jgi:RNA polymerase sigma-70 factor (ECF subfamily)
MPAGFVAASDPLGPLVRHEHAAWLQPLPDTMLHDPAGTAVERGTLRLAFSAALQHLSARQRGALVLRDVLGFSAAETAAILGATVASVNSSLQRARARMKSVEGAAEQANELTTAEERAWVDRYVKAFETADIEGLKRLLTQDVILEMPPMVNWFAGRGNYGRFMGWVFDQAGTDWRFRPVSANGGQPGFATYEPDGGGYRLHLVQIFTVTAQGISRISAFQDAEVFASFGLAPRLESDGPAEIS